MEQDLKPPIQSGSDHLPHHLRQTWFEVHLNFNISKLLTTTLKDLGTLLLLFADSDIKNTVLCVFALANWGSVEFLCEVRALFDKPCQGRTVKALALRIQRLPVCIVIHLNV